MSTFGRTDRSFVFLYLMERPMRRQVESRDSSKAVKASKESEISAMSSAYSRSDTDTSDINFFLLPTRSAANK